MDRRQNTSAHKNSHIRKIEEVGMSAGKRKKGACEGGRRGEVPSSKTRHDGSDNRGVRRKTEQQSKRVICAAAHVVVSSGGGGVDGAECIHEERGALAQGRLQSAPAAAAVL